MRRSGLRNLDEYNRLAYLEPSIEDLSSLLATDGAGNADLFITTNTEGAHGEAGLPENGCLASERLKHLHVGE